MTPSSTVYIAGIMLAVTACTQVAGPADDDNLDELAATFSPLGRHVIDTLREGHPRGRGLTWDVSVDNSLDAGWIIQTPLARYWGEPVSALPIVTACTGDPACDADFGLRGCASQADCTFGGTCTLVASTVARPGDAPRRLCVGHSDALYDDIYTLLAGARSSIDITSLGPPDGRFEAALRNALTYLSRSGSSVRVRVLYGAIPGAELAGEFRGTDAVLASLVRDLGGASSVRVAVGETRANVVSWNHTKTIIVDGHTAIAGGHNLWTRHYLQTAPVHDLSMRVSGTAAQHATKLVDELWRHTCVLPPNLFAVATISGYPDASIACHETEVAELAARTGDTRVLVVGRLGALGDEASDDAIVGLIDAATTRLRLSLQDIGPVGRDLPWPEPVMRALGGAISRGVDVELVMTNVGALPDGLTVGSAAYSNGWTPADVAEHLLPYTDTGALTTHFHGVTLRRGADEHWPDGAPFANHAKLVIADDRTFYLGSQNLYPSDLAELGFIVDDEAATRELLDGYFAKVWPE